MKTLLFTIFLLFTLGQLGRISFLEGRINFYLYEVALAIFLVILLIRYRFTVIRDYLIQNKQVTFFLSILVITFLLTAVRYNLFENFVGFLYLVRLLFYFVFLMVFTKFLNENSHAGLIRRLFFAFTIATIVTSFLQYFLYPDLTNLFYMGWDPHLYRVFGLFFEPPIAAGIYGLLFIYFQSNQKLYKRPVRFTLQTALFILILLTFSRSAYVAFFIISLHFLVKKGLAHAVLALLVCFLFLIVLLPKPSGEGVNLLRVSTIESRIVNYQQAFGIFLKHPVAGVGYNRIGFEKVKIYGVANDSHDYPDHAAASFQSSFLIILVSAGVIGLIAFLLMLYGWAQAGIFMLYAVMYLSTMSLFDNVLLHPFVFFVFIVCMVLTNRLSHSER